MTKQNKTESVEYIVANEIWANGEAGQTDPYVYLITHIPTGNKIIGSHCGTRGLRYTTCTAGMGADIFENPEEFEREILYTSDDLEDVRRMEVQIIHERNACEDPMYMNKKNSYHSPKAGAKKGKDHHFYGKKRKDHSEWMKANHPLKKLRKPIQYSNETKANMSEARRLKPPFAGMKHSEETKAKMVEAWKRRKQNKVAYTTCETCGSSVTYQTLGRWHKEGQCKQNKAV